MIHIGKLDEESEHVSWREEFGVIIQTIIMLMIIIIII